MNFSAVSSGRFRYPRASATPPMWSSPTTPTGTGCSPAVQNVGTGIRDGAPDRHRRRGAGLPGRRPAPSMSRPRSLRSAHTRSASRTRSRAISCHCRSRSGERPLAPDDHEAQRLGKSEPLRRSDRDQLMPVRGRQDQDREVPFPTPGEKGRNRRDHLLRAQDESCAAPKAPRRSPPPPRRSSTKRTGESARPTEGRTAPSQTERNSPASHARSRPPWACPWSRTCRSRRPGFPRGLARRFSPLSRCDLRPVRIQPHAFACRPEGSLSRLPCVSTRRAPASSSMKRRRSGGYAGSSGRYAPPAFRMPRSADDHLQQIARRKSPTRTSGPTPRASQIPRQPVRSLVQLSVRQPVPAKLHRHGRRRLRRLFLEELVHATFGRMRRRPSRSIPPGAFGDRPASTAELRPDEARGPRRQPRAASAGGRACSGSSRRRRGRCCIRTPW